MRAGFRGDSTAGTSSVPLITGPRKEEREGSSFLFSRDCFSDEPMSLGIPGIPEVLGGTVKVEPEQASKIG